MNFDFFENNLSVFKRHRGLILFEGILFFILGCLAIASPVIFTYGIDLLFGIIFVVGGATQLFRVARTWGVKGTSIALIGALITFFAGILLLVSPTTGILALTTVLAIYFVIAGIAKFVFAFRFQETRQKLWLCFSGLISLVLGGLIIAGLPGTSLWVLGLFIGIDLLFFGALLIGFYASLPE